MGYSTPKKQLDLKEFLSQPTKKPPMKRFGMRRAPTPVVEAEETAPDGEKTEG